jgi:hypothetical protein
MERNGTALPSFYHGSEYTGRGVGCDALQVMWVGYSVLEEHTASVVSPESRGSMFFRKVCSYLERHMVSKSGRPHFTPVKTPKQIKSLYFT